uniref:Nucleotide-diphospho-sugar transferase domain-containing protein n=1 Tax=Eucampia antarctica TaxID=49252 RepID=A0A7S2SC18_9STRA|mmetsp:Transcript_6117/g.5723  ORF Transcript_6117/g.5723 Transcript_6117/m.5723 type:complete len:338 (+) Transcript_6117:163-1176(+)
MKHFQTMKEYLDSRVDLLKRLRPIAEKIARKNTIIVMVVNKGQSDLLMNFACSSKAKDFDLSNVLVFATDEDTYKIVAGLGLAVFYDSKIFKDIPSKEARNYADASFASMMYAKVVSVQLINYLGFDVLFQDVDMIWFKNPLELFHDETSPMMKFDILFQDDGVRSLRYAPYSANSGFYYVRFNKKTRYLLISLLYQGDLIASTGSHQQVLAALLVEHSSTYGLRVKVLDGNITPGGYHYHNRRDFMRNIIAEKEDPYLFHMSWTQNKDNKLLFMKQMGWWYVSDSRIQSMMKEDDYLNARSCCIPIPQITCSYSDKPSAIPCKESPQIDKTGRPFW